MMDRHGGNIYDKRIELDFSVSLNPLGCPNEVINKMAESLTNVNHYPEPGSIHLRQEIAKTVNAQMKNDEIDGWHISEGNILCGNGASELFMAIVNTYRPRRVLTLAPTFSGYEYAINSCDLSDCENTCDLSNQGALGLSHPSCKLDYYRLKEDMILDEGILDCLHDELDMFFLCNPNNPTGKLIDYELLIRILNKCKHVGIKLVVDECFIELTEGGRSLADKLEEYDNLIIVRAYTKIFAIPGVRFGYLLSSKANVDQISKHLPEWNVSVVAEAAAIEAARLIRESDYISQTVKCIKAEKEYVLNGLRNIFEHSISKHSISGKIEVYESDTCFILIYADTGLHKYLLDNYILVRDCSNFTGLSEGFIRLGLKDHESNVRLIEAIEAYMFPS